MAEGIKRRPLKLTLMPVLDTDTGFPYPVIDQSGELVRTPDSLRFPRFNLWR